MTGNRSKLSDSAKTKLKYQKPTFKRFGLMSETTRTDPNIPPKSPEDDFLPNSETWGDPS